MKKLILLLALAVFTFNAHAQLNKKWSASHSLSGGVYETKSCGMFSANWTSAPIVTLSNEYYEPIVDSSKSVVRAFDSTGAVLWTTVIPQIASVSSFPPEDQELAGIPNLKTRNGFMMPIEDVFSVVNISPTSSRLIKIDSTGGIVWNINVANVNRISDWTVDSAGNTYLVGRTPQTVCGANMCNGIAVAKYNSAGQLQWKKTKYTSGGNFTMPSQIVLDNAGNVIVCGKKTAVATPNNTDIVVIKYSSTGTEHWAIRFNQACTIASDVLRITSTNEIPLVAYTTCDPVTSAKKAILKKLDATTGAVQWTKTINN